ncbi:hypothetical protein CEXT_518971 [Caerostris extrusa]|uniref:Uncharacterized protein n=1 Tax=Caerostris extrusa TaxID=172846 RepID=A0AAV4R3L0_CAEEX|nr:hypothetical protein CEXT_518971 [Caerostris extrusa]
MEPSRASRSQPGTALSTVMGLPPQNTPDGARELQTLNSSILERRHLKLSPNSYGPGASRESDGIWKILCHYRKLPNANTSVSGISPS